MDRPTKLDLNTATRASFIEQPDGTTAQQTVMAGTGSVIALSSYYISDAPTVDTGAVTVTFIFFDPSGAVLSVETDTLPGFTVDGGQLISDIVTVPATAVGAFMTIAADAAISSVSFSSVIGTYWVIPAGSYIPLGIVPAQSGLGVNSDGTVAISSTPGDNDVVIEDIASQAGATNNFSDGTSTDTPTGVGKVVAASNTVGAGAATLLLTVATQLISRRAVTICNRGDQYCIIQRLKGTLSAPTGTDLITSGKGIYLGVGETIRLPVTEYVAIYANFPTSATVTNLWVEEEI